MPAEAFNKAALVVKVKGAKFAAADMARLLRVEVDEEINLPSMCTISISMQSITGGPNYGADMSKYKLGDPVVVSMGQNKADEVFSGEVTGIAPTFGGPNTLEIRAYSKMHRLRFGTKFRSFKKKKDSEIAKQLAGEHGLSAKVDATTVKFDHLFQNNVSNYEFLLDRAKRINYELFDDGKKFHFRKPALSKGPSVTLTLEGENKSGSAWSLTIFEAEVTTLSYGSKVTVQAWDPAKQEAFKGDAKKGKELSMMSAKKTGFDLSKKMGKAESSILTYKVKDANEAKEIAKAIYNLSVEKAVSGRGECLGLAKIRTGGTIKLAGLGPAFSGTYYLTKTRHSWDPQVGYRTSFGVIRVGL